MWVKKIIPLKIPPGGSNVIYWLKVYRGLYGEISSLGFTKAVHQWYWKNAKQLIALCACEDL